jgi:poly(3-hydroxybutyrate) depolymerase
MNTRIRKPMNHYRKKFKILISAACLVFAFSISANQKVELDIRNISLSGLSSGGYMATQYHLSHADSVSGVGIIAAGPYNCARGSITTALSECVTTAPEAYPMSLLDVYSADNTKYLANKAALQNDRVWLLHGTLDTRIGADVANALHQQYSSIVKTDNLVYINNKPFAHVFPTIGSDQTCETSAAPFIGKCNYDAAGKLLTHIFGSLNDKVLRDELTNHGEFFSIDQSELADLSGTGMHDDGYLFVPKTCLKGEVCRVHVSFHGCNQSIDNVKDAYATQTGLNEWAATNNFVVLYPQVEMSRFMPMNPQSCWDWWGYTDENYANKNGKQIKAVHSMVNNLADYLNNRK